MDNDIYKIPAGAKIDFETGEMTLLFRDGTKDEFVAVMRGAIRAAKALEGEDAEQRAIGT